MEKYDVVIVGAGVGGLVCGCYLAKAGLKTAIIEQHDKPGGCCGSFKRKGYSFDVGVHYLGSVKKGILKIILNELKIDMKFNQIDPSDKIILPDNLTYIRTDYRETIKEFKHSFPDEKENIDIFFEFILTKDFSFICHRIKGFTFGQVMDKYFKNPRLKATFNLLLGNIGLSANLAAAIPSVVLLREYVLDSGHYPEGGMQVFADKLAEKFKSYNGKLFLGEKVVKIIVEKTSKRVIVNSGERFYSRIVVSNVDATQTFKELLSIKSKESLIVDKLIPSPSLFLVYLGLNVNLAQILKEKANLWYITSYDIDRLYSEMRKKISAENLGPLTVSFPSLHNKKLTDSNRSTATLFMQVPYKSKEFWEKNKFLIGDRMIDKVSEAIPGLKKYIDIRIHGTPYDLYRYTSNREGAFVGWLATLKQSSSSILPQITTIKDIFMVGHWCTMGYRGQGGVPNVALSGRRGALLVLKSLGKRENYKNESF